MSRKPESLPRVIVVLGPTGVGKSESLATLLDSRFEVINADSMQAYLYMDIGTAKPSKETLDRHPHHLMSILPPSAQFSAGEFVTRAQSLIAEIHARGRFPVVCGGTAFYIQSLLFGLPESPKGSPEIRSRLRRRERDEGHQALYRELAEKDPEAVRRIAANDRHRVIRALEILEMTGRSVFSFGWPRSLRGDFEFLILGLDRPREELYRRIERRVEGMFEAGLVDEVRGLIARGYGADDPGMRGIGYREFFEMQRGCTTLSEVKAAISADSRRYAKRQLTFFRALPAVRWLSPEEIGEIGRLMSDFVGRAP